MVLEAVVVKPSVVSEFEAVVLGSSVLMLDSVVTGPSLDPDSPDVVIWLLSVVEGVHPANSG